MFAKDIPLIWQPMNNPMEGEEVIRMPVINLKLSNANTLQYYYIYYRDQKNIIDGVLYKVKLNKKKTFRSCIGDEIWRLLIFAFIRKESRKEGRKAVVSCNVVGGITKGLDYQS